MRGFQVNILKVAECVPLKTAFCRFHDDDYKTGSYYLSAEAPGYDNIGFRVYIEKNSDDVTFRDDLNMMKRERNIK